MATDTKRQEPAYLRPRGLNWRSAGTLLVLQAVGWGCAAGLAYLVLSPELAKDYFSAHRTVKETWRLVVPALAIAAGAGFVAVGVGSVLILFRHSRRVLAPLRQIDGLIGGLAAGRVPRPALSDRAAGIEQELAVSLEPLRARVEEIQRIARDLQKISLELNYRSTGTTEVTRSDLRLLAAKFDALTKELTRASGWFEG